MNSKFLLVQSNQGSISLLIYTLMVYSYAAIMMIVFYYLPKKSGLVLDIFTGENLLEDGGDCIEISKSLLDQEQSAKAYMKA